MLCYNISKLHVLRKKVPPRHVRNKILRWHKAWNQASDPTAQDLRNLYKRTENRTKIVTVTRRAAQRVDELAAEVLMCRRRVLTTLPGDYEVNKENFDRGKLRVDRLPVPSKVDIRKGLRLHPARNCDKKGDFVNGMECKVKACDAHSRGLHMQTVTGRAVAVFQYIDPNPDA